MTQIKLFISSTFRDMDAERDLVLDVLRPRLQTILMQRHIAASIDVVDLRWGVNTQDVPEAERENKVLTECLDSIRASKPFFIGFLGHRYGWVPPRERWEAVVRSLTEGERAFMGDSIDEVKSVTELEMLFGALYDRRCLPASFFFLRGTEAYRDMDEAHRRTFVDTDTEAVRRQELLRQKIRAAYEGTGYEGNIISYDCSWDGERMHLDEDILDQVIDPIVNMIIQQEAQDEARVTELDLMNAQDELFITQSNACFAGRDEYLTLLMKGIQALSCPIVVTAPEGYGKSALSARLYEILKADNAYCPLIHFTQQRGPMAYAEAMLKKWLWTLPEPAVHRPLNLESQPWLLFEELCQVARQSQKHMVLIIDNAQYLDGLEYLNVFGGLPDCLSVVLTSDCNMDSLVEGRNACYIPLDAMVVQEASLLVDNYMYHSGKSLPAEAKRHLLVKQRGDGFAASSSPLWTVLLLNHLVNLGLDDFATMRSLNTADAADQITEYLVQEIENVDSTPAGLALQLVGRLDRPDGVNMATELLHMATEGVESLERLREHLRKNRGVEKLSYMDYMAARKILNPLLYADDIVGYTMCRYPRLFVENDCEALPVGSTMLPADREKLLQTTFSRVCLLLAASSRTGNTFVAGMLRGEAALDMTFFGEDTMRQMEMYSQQLTLDALDDARFSGDSQESCQRLFSEKWAAWQQNPSWPNRMALQCSYYAWCSVVQRMDECHSRQGEKGCPVQFLEQQIACLDKAYDAMAGMRGRSVVTYAAEALFFSVKCVQSKYRRGDMTLYTHYLAQQERIYRMLHNLLPDFTPIKRRLACVLDDVARQPNRMADASEISLRLFSELYGEGEARLTDVLYAGSNRVWVLFSIHRQEEALALADQLLEAATGKEGDSEVQEALAGIYDYQAMIYREQGEYEKALTVYGKAYVLYLEAFQRQPSDLVGLHDLCKNLKAQIDLCWGIGMKADSALNSLLQLTQYAVQTYPEDGESLILFMQARVLRLGYVALCDEVEGIVEEGWRVMAMVEQLTRQGVRYTYFEKQHVLTAIRALQANGHPDEADGLLTCYLHLRDELVGSRKVAPEWFEVPLTT